MIFDNSFQNYAIAAGVFISSFVVLILLKFLISNYLDNLTRRTQTDFDDFVIEQAKGVHWIAFVPLSLFIASRFLFLGDAIQRVVVGATVVAAVYVVTRILARFAEYSLDKVVARKQGSGGYTGSTAGIIYLLRRFIGIAIWSAALLFILSNFGVNLTTVIAGLGIGGIAIAFAMQSILSDIFNAFAIYLDRPFEIGDFIVIGAHAGTVEHIGIKSTRIKALRGEILVVSNKDVTSQVIQNFKSLQQRRIVFTFGIPYETPLEKVEQAPQIIQKIMENLPEAQFDRAHFTEFADSALSFEVVYYVTTANYAIYRDVQQEINLKIMREFAENGIGFAYPTRTIYTK